MAIFYLAISIIGGLGSISGSIYGAIFMTLLSAILSNMGCELQAVFGITIIFGSLGIHGELSLNPSQREGNLSPPPLGEARWGSVNPREPKRALFSF